MSYIISNNKIFSYSKAITFLDCERYMDFFVYLRYNEKQRYFRSSILLISVKIYHQFINFRGD